MFTIKECTAAEPACAACTESDCALAKRLGADVREGDRLFVLREGQPRAMGVLRLVGSKVQAVGVYGELDAAYRDLMWRALFNVCVGMNPIVIRVESTDPYFRRFGFAPRDGGMEVMNTEICFHTHA